MASAICANSQNNLADTSVDLDLLNAPANPAFNLMGISLNSIDKPTDLNSFRLSIQNASSSFTKFPSNYGVEFSPASIFTKKSQTLLQFNSSKFKDVFWQSFSVSFGLTRSNADDKEVDDSTSFSKIGCGIKFSFIRPHWNQNTAAKVDSFYYFLKLSKDEYTKLAKPLFDSNSEIKRIEKELASLPDPPDIVKLTELNNKLKEVRSSIIDALKDSLQKDAHAKVSNDLKAYAKGLKIERKGPFLDFATGVVLDFPDDKFGNSRIGKAGAWLTGGYENGNKGFSALGIARYLYQPDKIFADDSGKVSNKNISTFDIGARLALNGFQGKFSVNAEAIYRSVLNDNVIKPSWRFTFNAEYSVGMNQKITFAVGRNFNGTVTKDGNLIAAINFIRGFGSNKKTGNPAQQ